MADPTFRQLLPPSGAHIEARTFLDGLTGGRARPADRPLMLVNMVGTLDGNSSFNGRSAPLSDPGDRSLFHALRASADAIMAGTSTLGIEGYRPAGKPVVTVTRSGRLPTGIALFREREGRVIVFSGPDPDLAGVGADVSVEPLTDLGEALRTLYGTYGIRVLLCEGGPRLLGAVIRADLMDELFLTLAPKLAGGASGPSLTSGNPAPEMASLGLASVLERDGTLYLRYLRLR